MALDSFCSCKITRYRLVLAAVVAQGSKMNEIVSLSRSLPGLAGLYANLYCSIFGLQVSSVSVIILRP